MVTVTGKRTPLYTFHQRNGARFTLFGGWEMPLQYSGILEEHRVTRQRAGLFDVSHMGEVHVRGPQAVAFLDYLLTNDIRRLKEGQVLYSQMCYPSGGVVDDLLVYCCASGDYLLCINAANTEKDFAWMQEHSTGFDCEVKDVSQDYAQLAVQGPKAVTIVHSMAANSVESMPRFSFRRETLSGISVLLSRTGYTGEDGFEIYCIPEEAETVAEGLMDYGRPHGLSLVGLGARDSLRLEAGFPLYGHEISEKISPLKAGLNWCVRLDKSVDFIGKEALLAENKAGIEQRIVRFKLNDRRIARQGAPIFYADALVGEVVSGTLSPMTHQAIGTALVNLRGTDLNSLTVEVRKKQVPLITLSKR